MRKKGLLAMVVSLAIFLPPGCTNQDAVNRKKLNPDAIYFDYNVWGDEESGMVTVKLQFRYGGPDGPAIALDESAKVELDGEELRGDSSRMNGAWYEVTKSLQDFNSPHRLVCTGIDEKQYKEEFNFNVFYLTTELPGEMARDDLVFEFEGLEPDDEIKVLLTDTAFYSRGIDRVDTVRNGRISISREDLDNLKSGPVSLEFYREKEKALSQTTRAGGRISTSYSLKRVFKLED